MVQILACAFFPHQGWEHFFSFLVSLPHQGWVHFRYFSPPGFGTFSILFWHVYPTRVGYILHHFYVSNPTIARSISCVLSEQNPLNIEIILSFHSRAVSIKINAMWHLMNGWTPPELGANCSFWSIWSRAILINFSDENYTYNPWKREGFIYFSQPIN